MNPMNRQLPEDFMQLALTAMGDERFARFRDALDEEPPVSIRLNPLKTKSMRPVDGAVVPWCNEAFYLPSRPNFTFDPLLHAGCYYVQEAASMFIDLIVRQHIPHPVTMLDLCAAPGGKSTALLAALPEGSRLVSNEPVRQRFQVLSENLAKWGHEGSIAVNRYPADFRRDGFLFDAILCDVPCSGEGMFRKDPNAIGEWSLENVERCWRLQREIVGDAWQCLVPGGLLIYSTCTFNTLENEENIRWMQRELGAEVLPVETKEEWGITGSLLPGFTAPVYRFIPGLTRSEGLFMCVMRKPSDFVQRPCTKRTSPVYETYNADVRNSKGNKKGIAKAPKDEVPQPGEALLADGPEARWPKVDVDYATAVAYLRRQSIVLPPDVPRGFVVVSFQGHALGFAKNIGQRANNLYPKEWAIRSTYVPDGYSPVLLPV